MGKTRKRHNWKGRQVVETVVDNSETNKIKLDENLQQGSFDQSNALVLPAKKRKTTVINKDKKPVKILSKKQRKLLEKVVEKKAKKANRNSLLEALCQYQLKPEQLKELTSIKDVQTKGLKKYFQELQKPPRENFVVEEADTVEEVEKTFDPKEILRNSCKGMKRQRASTAKTRAPVFWEGKEVPVIEFDSSLSEISLTDDDADKEEDVESEQKTKRLKNEEEAAASTNPVVDEVIEIKEECDDEITENKKEEVKMKKDEIKPKPMVRKPAIHVPVNRPEDVQEARMKLPIFAEEQHIVETINENPVVILAGATGSGKTTQVPQFLYEAGYACEKMIAVTEPRRVAAISMSQRVAYEMGLTSREVSYLIRFEGNVTEDTKIKFMTDGVLLKEFQSDFKLSKYSVVILDEAHERSVYTDILIGMLSRVVRFRQKHGDPLKLIIMSATLRLEDFADNRHLFKERPPVIEVESRQFPVTVHFNRRTNSNYLSDAFKKVSKIHTKLPKGGILVFVTGEREVTTLVRRLRMAFGKSKKYQVSKSMEESAESEGDNEKEIEEALEVILKRRKINNKKKSILKLPKISLDDYSLPWDNNEMHSGDELDLDEDDDDEDDFEFMKEPRTCLGEPMWVLPLYSLLPSEKQAKVFKDPPEGYRLCIISTNVAETSLTIPNIKYVVDTGKTKIKLYDKVTGVSSYAVTWTSKASADQRAGRAGRTGPGHCYRIYSSAVFNNEFTQFSIPEIQQRPIDDIYLQLKCLYINRVDEFPFPTNPGIEQLKMAEKRLQILGALTTLEETRENHSKITQLGKIISKYPVLPRFGKMLVLSHQHNLMQYTICVVAALSVQQVLLETPIQGFRNGENDQKTTMDRWRATRLKWAGSGNSLLLGDVMVLLKAVGAAEFANTQGKLEQFCNVNGLRHKAVVEIRKIRLQLTNEIKTNLGIDIVVDPKMLPPTDLQAKLLRQILLSGMGDQIAKKVMPDELKNGEDKRKFKYAYRANNMAEPVFLHHGSVLKNKLPEFVVYQEIYETNKMYMRGVTAVEPEWFPPYVPGLCQLKVIDESSEPRFSEEDGQLYCTVAGTFGTQAWQIPTVEIQRPRDLNTFKWFAQFILEGKVLPKLQIYHKNLLSPPSLVHKTWGVIQKKVVGILNILLERDIDTRQDLVDAMTENPQFLLNEYLNWIPPRLHSTVTLSWPPLDNK